jgi:hypothetical protein
MNDINLRKVLLRDIISGSYDRLDIIIRRQLLKSKSMDDA